MANMCMNTLYITGPEADIDACCDHVRDGVRPFSLLKAYPPQDPDAWDIGPWQEVNHGTRGTAVFLRSRRIGPRSLMYDFETRWTPSLGVTEHLSRVFPRLVFTHHYNEPQLAVVGRSRFKAGVMTGRP